MMFSHFSFAIMQGKYNFIFIGGMPRVGKSEIAKELNRRSLSIAILDTDTVRHNGNDDDVAWQRVVDFVAKQNSDVVVAGVAVTPERVHKFKLASFDIKAIFIGYGDLSYVDVMLEHAEKHKEKYLYWDEKERLKTGKPSHRDAMPGEMIKSQGLQRKAETFGYRYVGATRARTLEEHVKFFADLLLK